MQIALYLCLISIGVLRKKVIIGETNAIMLADKKTTIEGIKSSYPKMYFVTVEGITAYLKINVPNTNEMIK